MPHSYFDNVNVQCSRSSSPEHADNIFYPLLDPETLSQRFADLNIEFSTEQIMDSSYYADENLYINILSKFSGACTNLLYDAIKLMTECGEPAQIIGPLHESFYQPRRASIICRAMLKTLTKAEISTISLYDLSCSGRYNVQHTLSAVIWYSFEKDGVWPGDESVDKINLLLVEEDYLKQLLIFQKSELMSLTDAYDEFYVVEPSREPTTGYERQQPTRSYDKPVSVDQSQILFAQLKAISSKLLVMVKVYEELEAQSSEIDNLAAAQIEREWMVVRKLFSSP